MSLFFKKREGNQNRKGEITSEQLVPIILIIIGFVIVLSVVVTLYSTTQADSDICHLSVLSRATTPISGTQSFISLKCTTNKICLTSDSGKCIESMAGEKYDIINLPSNQDESARIIEQQTVQAMYSCWNMMGQGKLDLFANLGTQTGLSDVAPRCFICNRIAIDKNVPEDVLSKVDIYHYMTVNNVPGQTLTYLQAFTDKSVNAYPNVDSKIFNDNLNKAYSINANSAPTQLSNLPAVQLTSGRRQVALVFMQVRSVNPLRAMATLGAGMLVAGSSFLSAPVLSKVGKAIVFSKVGGLATIAVASGALAYSGINSWAGQNIAAGYCGGLTSNQDAKKGCSIVEALPYDVKSINSICDKIEGTP